MRSERGQGTVEYVAAILLVAVALTAALAAAGAFEAPSALARALVGKLLCAVRLERDCGERAQLTPLALVYGSELAAEIESRAPLLAFERGEFSSLPVDPRRCRSRACADTSADGPLRRSFEGERPTAFVRVVDCRPGRETADADCGGERAGNLYLQYWFFYPDSATRPYGRAGFHPDDWESFMVRIAPDGSVLGRASSHKGYNGGRAGPQNALSDLGYAGHARWGTATSRLRVAAGSHAGSLEWDRNAPRWIDPRALRLLPLEPLVGSLSGRPYAVSPPWRKSVWTDPESPDT